MTIPDLSIVIPTHNRPALLRRAVASVVAALPPDAEVVIVDDASTPPAEPGLDGAFHSSAPLRIVRNPIALGPAGARNAGVTAAQGRIVLFLDDDDLLRPGYPEAVLFAAGSPQRPRWGFSPILTHSDPADSPPDGRVAKGGSLLAGPATRKHLGGLGCGFWIEKRLFLDAGSLNDSLWVNEDMDLCLRLMSLGHWPWLGSQAGVSVLKDNSGSAGAPSVTRETKAATRADYFGIIQSRNAEFLSQAPQLKTFLRRRHLKMLVRGERRSEAFSLARSQGSIADLAVLAGFVIAERLR